MPRKSRASLEIVPFEPHMARIKTPPGLDGVERELFERIVKETSPMHFTGAMRLCSSPTFKQSILSI